jgi:hypothetical protein
MALHCAMQVRRGRQPAQLAALKSGGFQFAARFYGPGRPLIDGSYEMPGVVKEEQLKCSSRFT